MHPESPEFDHSSRSVIDGVIQDDIACLQCAYNLRGLDPSRNCPECGMPAGASLRGNLLRYCAPEYLAQLHRGVVIVLSAIIAQIILSFCDPIVKHSLPAGLLQQSLAITIAILNIVVAAGNLYGWWLFSALDPSFVGQEAGETARQWIRWTTLTQAIAMAIWLPFSIVLGFLVVGGSAASSSPGPLVWILGGLVMIVAFLSLVAQIVGYFSALSYIEWLAHRIPSQDLGPRAKRLRWLGPVLTIFLCIIGLLVALVLYWNLLDDVRKHFKRIRAEQQGLPA